MSKSPSLKKFLLDALSREARGKRDFELHVLRSQPKRSHSLFPWASDLNVKIYVEHLLLVVAEKPQPIAESASNGESKQEANGYVPVYALEAASYTVSSTSTSLIYISKVDTTGLLATPAPSRPLTTAFLDYWLLHPPHATKSLRIHVFARSQSQYLFPGSVDNKAKRVLGDNQLMKWWRSVLGEASARVFKTNPVPDSLKMFYMLGGCTLDDSLGILARAAPPEDTKAPKWEYGHPYDVISPPVPTSSKPVTLNDLIPAFQDDPKARQLTEWASSPIPYAGQDDDYDEVMEKIRKVGESSTALHALRAKEMLNQRTEDRAKLLKDKDMESFWLVMGNRGECSSGHIAGFFVVTRDTETDTKESPDVVVADAMTGETQASSAHALPASLPHSAYVKLWSGIHNVDYASYDKAVEGYNKWKDDSKSAVLRLGSLQTDYEEQVYGTVEVDNPVSAPEGNPLKRADPSRQVNTLMVKKKKKV